MRNTATALFAVLALTFATTFTTPSFAQTEDEAVLTVIHGVPGLPEMVDIYADGNYLFSFDFMDSEGPLPLPEGMYFLEVKLQGETVLSADAMLEAGKNYTAIAHLTYIDGEDAGLKLSLFENNVQVIDSRRSRLDIRHTADAPAVDIELLRDADSGKFFARRLSVANNDAGMPQTLGESEVQVRFTTAVLYPAGDLNPVFASPNLLLERETYYIIYAVGSLFDGSFDLIIQTIDLETERVDR